MLIIRGDGLFEKYADKLATLEDKMAVKAIVPALNRGGDFARTRIKRSLVKGTGIVYGLINEAIKTKRATKSRLEYELVARGDETNVSLFRSRQVKRGVSAAPWKRRRIFKGAFLVRRYANKAYVREGDGRYPIKPLFGPNIGREIVRDPHVRLWDLAIEQTDKRLAHELARLFNI